MLIGQPTPETTQSLVIWNGINVTDQVLAVNAEEGWVDIFLTNGKRRSSGKLSVERTESDWKTQRQIGAVEIAPPFEANTSPKCYHCGG